MCNNMNKCRCKRQLPLLNTLSSIEAPRHIGNLLPNLSDSNFSFLCECLQHLLDLSSPHLKVNKEQRDLLRRFFASERKNLLYLANPRKSTKNKKKLISKVSRQTGGAHPLLLLLGEAIPVITNLISKWIGGKT